MNLRMRCLVCRGDVSGSRQAVAHVPFAEFGRVQRERQEWDREHGGQVLTLGELLSHPTPARWEIHCDSCNPHRGEEGGLCGGCYWFSLERCVTATDLLQWTAHLMGKTWLEHTNWDDFIRHAAASTGARTDP